ncbi:MAG: NUDIX domain-containing protein [Alphaproteobacteria bacterium]|nr:NUDIX domain-containing protein [Alphaproteobacteria bacterium]
MEIIKRITNIFSGFEEKNYTKIFVNLNDVAFPILLSYIDNNTRQTIEPHLKDYFTWYNDHLYLLPTYNTPQKITEVFGVFAKILQEQGILKLRGENIVLQSVDGKHNFGHVDRALLHIFGLLAHGVHLNAYVEVNGTKHLWIARRSKTKIHDPLKLDNLVAGAVSLGYSDFDTLFKEAGEEAGIPQDLAVNAVLAKNIAYKVNKYGGLRNDIVHIFELSLPQDFIPTAVDGEVEEFFLMESSAVENMLIADFEQFKYNSALTILHFLYHHNLIKNLELHNFLDNLFN